MKKILILGYFGHGNTGDDTALQLLCSELRGRKIEYSIFPNSEKSACRRLLGLTKALEKSSALLFCGGNLLQNETSNRSLLYYLLIIERAKRLKIPVLFAFSGIGEINGKFARQLTARALSGVDFFGARTHFDLSEISPLKIKTVALSTDIAFTLSSDRVKKRDEFAYIPSAKNPKLEKKIMNIAKALSLRPIVIPFFAKRDGKLCAKASRRLDAPYLCFQDRASLLSALSACRFAVSDRLHGGIFSLVAHTPTFLNDSQEKCRALIDEIAVRAGELNIKSPLMTLDELCIEKIKELGAENSEFDILLSSLHYTAELGLEKLIRRLNGAVML